MKFSATEDIEAPIEQVFGAISDFTIYERAAMRRGADVRRVGTGSEVQVGMKWQAVFDWRKKTREVEVELIQLNRPEQMTCALRGSGFLVTCDAELIALARGRTRIKASLDIKPRNLSARLMIQSMKLARSSLAKRYKRRVADYAKELERQLNRSV